MLLRRAAEQRLSDSCRHEASGGKLLAVELTERVQLQWHCEGVDENSAALACEGVDENARAVDENSWQSRQLHQRVPATN